jgi:hypothetical protein
MGPTPRNSDRVVTKKKNPALSGNRIQTSQRVFQTGLPTDRTTGTGVPFLETHIGLPLNRYRVSFPEGRTAGA